MLRNPDGLNFSHRAAPSKPTWERSNLLGNKNEVLPENICVQHKAAAQAESWGAWQHSAGLISAHVMLQALKPHLNLVPSYGSLPGPALLLPVLDSDILVHSLPCTLSALYRNSLLISEAKIKLTTNICHKKYFGFVGANIWLK